MGLVVTFLNSQVYLAFMFKENSIMTEYMNKYSSIKRALRNKLYRFIGYVDEATLLENNIQRKNLENPNWDEPARRAALRGALNRGVDLDALIQTYGDKLVDQETKNLP